MPDTPQDFYDQLAPDYHLIFADWHESIARQASALGRLLRQYDKTPPATVLDCAAGIGTQALGLAGAGYRVHATDLSPAAIQRAAAEAARLQLDLTTGVADFRSLDTQVAGQFDVVLACDNALPHLLTEDDVRLALENMRARLAPDGLLVVSVRDYDHYLLERPHATLPHVVDTADERRVMFQVWDWAPDDAPLVTITLYVVRTGTVPASPAEPTTHAYSTTYRAWRRVELTDLMQQAGLDDIRWQMPQDTGYFQPLVTARSLTSTGRS